MTSNELLELARRVLADLDVQKPGRRAGSLAGLPTAEAYVLQQAVATLREQRGETVIGYKVGCTSRAVREQLGVSEPIFGRVFDTGCVSAGSRIRHEVYANLAIEGELAIRLSRDICCGLLSDEEYDSAIASVFPVIELHHYVLPVSGSPVAAMIASSGMHAGLVLPGKETPSAGRVPMVTELDVTIHGRLAGRTVEPWTMGDPATTLRWLSTRLAEQDLRLRAGQVILTGSALPLYPVQSGDRVVAEARPLGMSSVEIDG